MVDYYESFSKLSEDDKLAAAQAFRDEAWYANLEWLEAAETAHKFKAGDQWSDEEKYKLQMQGREPQVWNYIHSFVELATGILTENPVRIYPYPVEVGDGFLCEVLEDLVTHIDTNQVDAEEDLCIAFENSVITGVGDIVIDVGPDPNNPEEIHIAESAMEAYEVLIDPMSKRADLKDARYVIYEKWVTLEDFKMRYPKQAKNTEEIFKLGYMQAEQDRTAYAQNTYTGNSTFEYYDYQNKRILVTHLEYREAYKRYYYVDPDDKSTEITKEEVARAKEVPGRIVELYDTKIFWMHYIHDRILWEGESPVYKNSFSLCRLSAYTDKSTRQHVKYGIVKLMIDPQKECNRRWLHTQRLLTRQGVGVMAEIDAFHDLAQAQDSWADPDAFTLMAKGGLNKVKEKAVPSFPDAPMRLEEMNKEAIKQITGINPDLMGVAQQRREPGINLKLRRQQGMTILAKLFKNYRKTAKEIYKRKLEIIVRYMPDSQIRRILGENANYTFQQGYIIDQKRNLVAPIRKIRDLEYNIRMEDAPGGINKMLSELAVFMEMMEKGFPTNPNTVIDKLDLSPIEKADWKAFVAEQQKSAQDLKQTEINIKKAEVALKTKTQQDDAAIKQQELSLMKEGKVFDAKVNMGVKQAELKQRENASERDFTAKVMSMDANEKRDLVEILKWVHETTLKQDAADTGRNTQSLAVE